MKFRLQLLIIAILAVAVNIPAFSQVNPNKKFKELAQPSKLVVKNGESFVIRLTVKMDKIWYTYSLKEQLSKEGIGPTTSEITILSKDLIDLNGKITESKLKKKYDKGFEMNIEIHEGTFFYDIPVKAKKDLDFNKDKVLLEYYLQWCDTTKCLGPEAFKIRVSNKPFLQETDTTVQAVTGAQTEPADSVSGSPSDTTGNASAQPADTAAAPGNVEPGTTEGRTDVENAKREGILSYLLFAMSFGFVGLLTPCVYPMIPITVSFFTKRSEKEKSKGLRDAFLYALGIITTFTALGIVVAAIAGPAGLNDMAASWQMNIGLAALFMVFAFNLFGAFEIRMPTGIMNKLNTKSTQGSGIFSVMLMGLTFSLTSFTCTVPFVGIVLADTSTGEWFYPIIGMLGYSFIFAVPFFFLALFPSLLSKLPKSGGWMNNMKVVMGFLEIAFAIKFLSNVDLAVGLGMLPRELFLAAWIGMGALIVLYLLGTFKMKLDSPVDRVGGTRISFVILFTVITFYLLSGMGGGNLGMIDSYLPPPKEQYDEMMNTNLSAVTGDNAVKTSDTKQNNGVKQAEQKEQVFLDYKTALDYSKKVNKPLFIDFTGVTCTNCRYMEINMFTRKSIEERLNQYVKVKLFTDRRIESDKANKKMQQERYNTVELPLYVLLTPDEKQIATMSYTSSEDDFRAFLDKGLKAMAQ